MSPPLRPSMMSTVTTATSASQPQAPDPSPPPITSFHLTAPFFPAPLAPPSTSSLSSMSSVQSPLPHHLPNSLPPFSSSSTPAVPAPTSAPQPAQHAVAHPRPAAAAAPTSAPLPAFSAPASRSRPVYHNNRKKRRPDNRLPHHPYSSFNNHNNNNQNNNSSNNSNSNNNAAAPSRRAPRYARYSSSASSFPPLPTHQSSSSTATGTATSTTNAAKITTAGLPSKHAQHSAQHRPNQQHQQQQQRQNAQQKQGRYKSHASNAAPLYSPSPSSYPNPSPFSSSLPFPFSSSSNGFAPSSFAPLGAPVSTTVPGLPQVIAPTPAPRVHHVTTVEQCCQAMERLLVEPQIALDCEGVALSRTGRLCLLQLATMTDVYLVDLIDAADEASTAHAQALFSHGGLRALLEAKSVTKIVHDCRHDSDALFHQYGVKLNPVIDTQIVFGVLRRVRGLPEGLPVSLRTLLKKFASASDKQLACKSDVKDAMKEDAAFWLRRPFPPLALSYAVLDVQHLLPVTQLLAAHIAAAALDHPNAWADVENESAKYAAVFRDDDEGPRKAQLEYEARARVARRQRFPVDQARRVDVHQKTDPMRRFAFEHQVVVQSLSINS